MPNMADYGAVLAMSAMKLEQESRNEKLIQFMMEAQRMRDAVAASKRARYSGGGGGGIIRSGKPVGATKPYSRSGLSLRGKERGKEGSRGKSGSAIDPRTIAGWERVAKTTFGGRDNGMGGREGLPEELIYGNRTGQMVGGVTNPYASANMSFSPAINKAFHGAGRAMGDLSNMIPESTSKVAGWLSNLIG